MADRYPERPYPADDNYDRGGGSRAPSNGDGDPLAELARLIGASDFAMGRANLQVQPRTKPRDQYDQQQSDPYELPAEADDAPPPSPPSWMQRVARQEQATPLPQPDYPSAVHPLHRYAAANPAPEADYEETQDYADADQSAICRATTMRCTANSIRASRMSTTMRHMRTTLTPTRMNIAKTRNRRSAAVG